MAETNLSHEHLAKGSTHAPQVKSDVIHLYLNKSIWGGPDTVNHRKLWASTQSETKLATVPISRILKENGEICPSIRSNIKVMR